MIKFIRNLFQLFPAHLLENSPWPILVSFSLLSLTLSAVMYMHGYNNGGPLLTLGTILTLYGMALWFRDIIKEGTFEGSHTKEVQKGLLLGFMLFVVSEIFAFLSVFWAYFHSALSPAIEIGAIWPPQGIIALNAFGIPLINTVILLSSGGFITYSHHGLNKGDRELTITGTFATIILAFIFTGFQGFEYFQAPFTFADSVFGSTFFASTGLHGLHVMVGTIFIAVGFFRIINYHLSTKHSVGLDTAIIYWHFVDIVWLFLFLSVYYWGGN